MYILNFSLNVYFWEREYVRKQGRGRDTDSDAPGSELSAQSPTGGSNSWTVRSWCELRSYAYRLSHPGAPSFANILNSLSPIFKIFYFFSCSGIDFACCCLSQWNQSPQGVRLWSKSHLSGQDKLVHSCDHCVLPPQNWRQRPLSHQSPSQPLSGRHIFHNSHNAKDKTYFCLSFIFTTI